MRRVVMRFGVCLFYFGATLGIVAAATEPPKLAGTAAPYAGVPWGSAPDTIKSTLAQRGYQYVQTDADGDLVFSSTSGQLTGEVYEALNPSHHLLKALVVIHPAESDLINVYHSLVKVLTDKYGAPSAAFEDYDGAYRGASSDRDKRAAIAAGNGTLSTFWMYVDGSSLYLQVTNKLTVEANYESPQWSAEAARRKSAAPKAP